MTRAKRYRLGLDIGGTKIAGVLLLNNKVVENSVLATPKDTLDHFLIMSQAVLEPLLHKVEKNKGEIIGLGIGIPGVIDIPKQKIINVPNVPILNKQKLGELLKERLNMPNLNCLMDNDVNCFIRAEAVLGAGRKSNNVYGLTIGTGIGGGWWYNGDVYYGAYNAAGEPGHMVIDADNGLTLQQAYNKLTQNNAATLAQEAYRGDRLAEKSFEEFGKYLGTALSTIVNIIDPEIIIMGGGVMSSGDLFLTSAKESLAKFTFTPQARTTKLVKGKLGPMAGAIGAALLPKEKSKE